MKPMPDGTEARARTARFPVFDCDGHVAEPRALWDEYCDPAFRAAAKRALYVHNFPEGGSGMMLDGRCIVRGIEAVTFAGQNPRDFLGKYWDDGHPGAFDPAHRLRDMDLEGIDLAMVFPSLVAAIGGISDPPLAAAMARAYNRWILDYCATDPHRLFGVAVVPLQDPPRAVAEVEWAAGQGMRCVMVRPARYRERTLDHADFARFFAASDHHGLVVGMHPFPFADVDWTGRVVPDVADVPGSGIMMADMACLPLDNMLAMAYLMFGGVCDRHPQLKLSFLESNGTWAASWIERMEARFKRGNHARIATAPSEILARQCFVSIEGDEKALPPLVDLIGEDVLIWASDFPHFDGHFPGAVTEALGGMAALPERVVRKVLGENAARMYGIPLRRDHAPVARVLER